MADEEAPGQDWRSVETRAADHVALGTAHKRAAEPGRGREAKRPQDIPSRGWADILWRVVWSIPQDRVLATTGGVAFFALLAVFSRTRDHGVALWPVRRREHHEPTSDLAHRYP